jgi:hypothetical protein
LALAQAAEPQALGQALPLSVLAQAAEPQALGQAFPLSVLAQVAALELERRVPL